MSRATVRWLTRNLPDSIAVSKSRVRYPSSSRPREPRRVPNRVINAPHLRIACRHAHIEPRANDDPLCGIFDAQDERVDHSQHLIAGFAGQQFTGRPEVVVKRAPRDAADFRLSVCLSVHQVSHFVELFQNLEHLVEYSDSAPLRRLDVAGTERREICRQGPPWPTSGTHPENGIEDCASVATLFPEAIRLILGEQVANTSPRCVREGRKH
jgi:hypothetical protein